MSTGIKKMLYTIQPQTNTGYEKKQKHILLHSDELIDSDKSCRRSAQYIFFSYLNGIVPLTAVSGTN